MKRFLTSLLSLFIIVISLPSFADTYQPLVLTLHDAYLYYLQKAKNAALEKNKPKAIQYYKLAMIYASSKSEMDAVENNMRLQLKAEEIIQVTAKAKQGAVDSALSAYQQPSNKPLPVPAPVSRRAEQQESVTIPVLIKDVVDKQALEIPYGETVIIERPGVKRFMMVDEGFVDVKLIEHGRMQLKAIKRGSTFMHLWDENGRTTIYLKVIFLLDRAVEAIQKDASVEHNEPFKISYSTDWSSYYQGPSIAKVKRQDLSFLQNLAVDGPTPYGNIDSNMTFSGFDRAKQIESYTVGVSHIPMPGTNDLNVRAFDAVRNLSPLTMYAPRLRGFFGDVDVLDSNLRFSYSHGQIRPAFGFMGLNSFNSNKIDSYVDAGRIVLFPNDFGTHYAINVASGYGNDRDASIAKKAYSLEAQQKIDRVILKTELARNDDDHNAMTAGLRYDDRIFSTALNFRDINKSYTNVLNAPSSQGEIGTVWSTNTYTDRFDLQSAVDLYQNRLYFNPENPDAVNLDSNLHFHMPITPVLATDAGVSYVHTPGELSPRMNFSMDDRMSMTFDTWNNRHGVVYAGGAYQRSRYSNTPLSAFDRLTALVGVSLPITERLSAHGKYEFSWVDEPNTTANYNPRVFDIGLNYYRPINPKLAVNMGLNYRREDGLGGTNSFLAGEDSADGSIGLNYNPAPDLSIFFDSRLRRVWPKLADLVAYYALDVRLGMRMRFGSGIRFDPYGKVAGYVFDDENGNGLKEHGEAGIPNVKVKVGDTEVTTDQEGRFEKSMSAKAVIVTPNSQTIPPGYVFSSKDSLRASIVQIGTTDTNFGVTAHSSVYGIIYVDRNNNGQPDLGDKFIPRVQLVLDGKIKQNADDRGAYYFRNISVGKHTLQLVLDSVPIEYVPMGKIKLSFDVGRGATYVQHFPLRFKEQQ